MKSRECQCGEFLGERCEWQSRPGDARRVRLVFVPPVFRATAQAAGTIRGVTSEILVEAGCARRLLEDLWVMRPARARRLMIAADRAAVDNRIAAILRR